MTAIDLKNQKLEKAPPSIQTLVIVKTHTSSLSI